jgi:hypothetical protein
LLKGFWVLGCVWQTPIKLYLVVLLKKKLSFCQTKPKKIIKKYFFSCIWLKILKLFKLLFFKNLKYFDMFFFLIIYGFYNKFVKFERILVYILKIPKNFILFILIHGIMNLYERYIPDIKIKKDFFCFF